MRRRPIWLSVSAAIFLAGCEAHQVAPPPVTLEQYNNPGRAKEDRYPPHTVVLHNLQRVLDPALGEQERLASLRLVVQLSGGDESVTGQLAGILTDDSQPAALREGVLALLLRRDHPGLARYVVQVVPRLGPQSKMKEQVLEWLGRHPTPAVLAEVVRLWAQEESVASLNEPRYRQAVERTSGKPWDQALLGALATPGFGASGAALQVLAGRVPDNTLRQRVVNLPGRTEAVVAMDAFIRRFAYLPTTDGGLRKCVWLHKTRGPLFDGAAELSRHWRETYGYRFDVRDFHLLSRLEQDPLRRGMRRTELIIRLAHSLLKRPHVPRRVSRPTGLYDFSDRFSKHVESLTMADLWNLYLLDGMLARPRVQIALRIMAEGDREDANSAWGGVAFYQNGQAEAKLFPAAVGPSNDRTYRPGPEGVEASLDALCLLHGHFWQMHNSRAAGPTAEQLRAAKEGSHAGLVLTGIDEESFCAHYYNPKGIVISLGKFPFR